MTPLSDPHVIQPFTQPINGSVSLPGSKSISNRSLLLAAMSQRRVVLHDCLFSRDTEIMMQALQTLGFTVESDPVTRRIEVEGLGGSIPVAEADIDVGNSGTSARLLTAFLAIRNGGVYHLDGDEPMRKRPMRGLLTALESSGAATIEYHAEPGFFPFTLKTHGYAGGTMKADASESSQILSALMMALPFAKKDTTVHVLGVKMRTPYVVMTLDMMEQFGQAGSCDFTTLTFHISAGCPYPDAPANYVVEPDASAASYFLALPAATGGELTIHGLGAARLQGDLEYAQVLEHAGLKIERDLDRWIVREAESGLVGATTDFYQISDTFLTQAAVAALMETPTRITGIGHTRHQETDRIAAMATELGKLGVRVEEGEGEMTIYPDRAKMREVAADGPIAIDTYEDHRVAMSFGVLGSYDLFGDGRPWISIKDPKCCSKTFPDFFHVLESLREETVTA